MASKSTNESQNQLVKLENVRIRRELTIYGPHEGIKKGHENESSFVFRKEFKSLVILNSLKPYQINLPLSVLKICMLNERKLLNTGEPLTFHLHSTSSGSPCYAVGGEFTANENTIGLSECVANVLNYKPGDLVSIFVTWVQLPKGDFVKLEVDASTINNVLNLDRYMEEALSYHSILYKDQVIELNIPGDTTSVRARCKALIPNHNAVSINDCDLKVDIDLINTESCSDSYTSLNLASELKSTIKSSPLQYKVKLFTDGKWGSKILIVIDLKGPLNMYVSFPPLKEANSKQHHFKNNGNGGIKLSYADYREHVLRKITSSHSPKYLLIGLEPADKEVEFSLNVHFSLYNESVSGRNKVETADSQSTKQCIFCGLFITAANQDAVFKRTDIDNSLNLCEHEIFCGSRTENCDICGLLLPKKFMQLHIDYFHCFDTKITLCPVCNKNYQWNSADELWNHLYNVHSKLSNVCINENCKRHFVAKNLEDMFCSMCAPLLPTGCLTKALIMRFYDQLSNKCPNPKGKCKTLKKFCSHSHQCTEDLNIDATNLAINCVNLARRFHEECYICLPGYVTCEVD